MRATIASFRFHRRLERNFRAHCRRTLAIESRERRDVRGWFAVCLRCRVWVCVSGALAVLLAMVWLVFVFRNSTEQRLLRSGNGVRVNGQ
jgi:hypothetical protein